MDQQQTAHLRGLIDSTGWELLAGEYRRRLGSALQKLLETDEDGAGLKSEIKTLKWVLDHPTRLLQEDLSRRERAEEEERNRAVEDHYMEHGFRAPFQPPEIADE